MFQFNRDFEEVFRAARSVEVARQLNPSLQTFEQWLRKNGSRIRVALNRCRPQALTGRQRATSAVFRSSARGVASLSARYCQSRLNR